MFDEFIAFTQIHKFGDANCLVPASGRKVPAASGNRRKRTTNDLAVAAGLRLAGPDRPALHSGFLRLFHAKATAAQSTAAMVTAPIIPAIQSTPGIHSVCCSILVACNCEIESKNAMLLACREPRSDCRVSSTRNCKRECALGCCAPVMFAARG